MLRGTHLKTVVVLSLKLVCSLQVLLVLLNIILHCVKAAHSIFPVDPALLSTARLSGLVSFQYIIQSLSMHALQLACRGPTVPYLICSSSGTARPLGGRSPPQSTHPRAPASGARSAARLAPQTAPAGSFASFAGRRRTHRCHGPRRPPLPPPAQTRAVTMRTLPLVWYNDGAPETFLWHPTQREVGPPSKRPACTAPAPPHRWAPLRLPAAASRHHRLFLHPPPGPVGQALVLWGGVCNGRAPQPSLQIVPFKLSKRAWRARTSLSLVCFSFLP